MSQATRDRAAAPATVPHHDLAAAPFKPSRVLTAWVAQRQSSRRAEAAARELSQAQAAFRRHAGHALPRRQLSSLAADAYTPGVPQPGFPVVDGQRAFAASATDRLSAGWSAVNTGINADLEAALATLRARSRDWCMNTDLGERYITLCADNIVGDEPPRLQVRATLADGSMDEAANTAVEQAWAVWCAGLCDVAGALTFGQMLRIIAEAVARDGEALGRHVRDRRLPHGYALQLLDVDRIDTARNQAPQAAGQPAIRLGVEVDVLGRSQALYLHAAHPGDAGSGLAPRSVSQRVPIDQLLHAYVRRRPEQVRGYPWTAATLKRSASLAKYEEYAMVAARIGAAKMGFYTVDKDTLADGLSLDDLKDATGALVQDVEPGMLEALPPGVDFKSFDPDYPHQNYGPFVDKAQHGLASGLNVAHHNLSGNMSGVNYSSARIAELSERRHWRAMQAWLISAVVRPVFVAWLQSAMPAGAVRLPSGAVLPADRWPKFAEAAKFQPPGWAWVDPEADIKAAAIAATYDLRSLRQITDEQGVDLDDVIEDKARLKDKYQTAGLPVPSWLAGGMAMTVAGTPPAAPAPAAPAA